MTPRSSSSPRTLSPRLAYALAGAIIGLALFASGTPSPLYGIYRELWGFSPLVLTLVYATYAFGVLAALLLAGRVSDDVGRRPVLLTALATLMGATVLFTLADSVVWLFVARGVQGLATGAALGAASASLLDLHPRRDPAGVGLTNGVVSAGGMGLGVLVSAAFVEFLPAPRVLPYVALFVLFAIALEGVWRMPEPVAERSRLRLTPQWPSVPSAVRRPSCSPPWGSCPRGRSAGCSSRSDRSSRRTSSTRPTISWPVSASSHWPAPPPSRRSSSAARRRGPEPPPDRSRSPRAWS
jgi:MFS family permease